MSYPWFIILVIHPRVYELSVVYNPWFPRVHNIYSVPQAAGGEDYYSIAHTVHEEITEQASILVGGKLKVSNLGLSC